MVGTIIGCFSFGAMLLFDISALLNKKILQYIMLVFALGTLGYGLYDLMRYNHQFEISFGFFPVLIVLDVVFFILLIYSIVIEVRINQTLKGQKTELVTNGTYSISRHPGVIWLFFVFIISAIILENYLFLIAGGVWTLANSVYVYYQERFVLTKLFKSYSMYQQTTPMLIPTINSIKKITKRTLEE